MSELSLDDKTISNFVNRLVNGKVTLRDQGLKLEVPDCDLVVDVAAVQLEGEVSKGGLVFSLNGVRISEKGIAVKFSVK